MEMRKPSRTAVNTAVWRAVHTLLDHEPKILADPFARGVAGFDTDEALLAAHDAHPASHVPGIRAPFAVRTRYAEDELAEAVGRGIGQYVILGAGLDSFAYRRPDLMRALDVYEVDHAATQAWKQARVAELGIATPPGLHHVPIDFERETLAQGLAAGGCGRPSGRSSPGSG
jgi:methyltransferase (TIGR00027 family)